MKKISKRAWMALALAAALLAGLLVFFGEYFIEAKTWVAFPGSPHVYTGVNPDCGTPMEVKSKSLERKSLRSLIHL